MHMRFLGVKKYAEKKKNILNASDKMRNQKQDH